MHSKSIGKRSILLFLAFTLIQFTGWAQSAATPYRMKTVVIDAGHGGKDPGNLGTGRYKTREKDIALDVALRVGGYIKEQFPEVKVIYTRSTDVFIGLDGRAEIANDAKADLFISIHCNSAANTSAYGVETFALGLHRNKENLDVAMKENSAIFLEDDYETKYEGFDPNSAESIIALTIMQSAYLQQSLSISSYIQKQFKERVGRRDRGVKQAGFLVLRKTTMPSILVELGFLTNEAEEDYLNSENGKAYMSSAIFRGFKEYKELVEDPLPAGAVKEPKQESGQIAPVKADEEKAKKEALAAAAAKKNAEKAHQYSIDKAANQTKLKAEADSLELAKQKLVDQKKKREAELAAKDHDEEKARLKAKVDSLEELRLEKIRAFEKKENELADQRAKELAEKKAKEEVARKAKEEKDKKELESKSTAKEWLEEIKEVKEKELEDAKQKTATDTEKDRLLAIKKQKEQELAEARRLSDQKLEKQQTDSLAARKLITEQVRIDSLAKARSQENVTADSLAAVRTAQKHLDDSLNMAKIREVQVEKEAMKEAALAEAGRLAEQQATQDSIAAVRKAEADSIALTIDNKQAASAEEAELLFLQLRKKQLEQRIATLKGQNVEEVTEEKLEQRATQKPAPEKKVDTEVLGGLQLKVQVVTSAEPMGLNSPKFKAQKVWEYQQGGLYKYTVGSTQDFEEIVKLQGELRDLGFKGAFVVAFNNGERIKVSEARELLKR